MPTLKTTQRKPVLNASIKRLNPACRNRMNKRTSSDGNGLNRLVQITGEDFD
ncbi:UNVERIFIED_CONTAM: hypothetical protein FKN15_059437 [Acipenser sinensis]